MQVPEEAGLVTCPRCGTQGLIWMVTHNVRCSSCKKLFDPCGCNCVKDEISKYADIEKCMGIK